MQTASDFALKYLESQAKNNPCPQARANYEKLVAEMREKLRTMK